MVLDSKDIKGVDVVKRSYEFDTRYSELEQKLEEREEGERTKIFKVCPKCGKRKPVYQFSTDKRNTNGRTNTCKVCRVIEYLKYYHQNRDRILIVNKKYRDDHKRERTKYFQDYQENHKEHLQVVGQKWYKKNRKRIKERNLKLKRDKRRVKMNYYICEECEQRYCGWAISVVCQKCGGRLKPITREEFHLEKKRVVIEEEV